MSTKLQSKIRCEKAGEEFIDETLSSVGRTSEEEHYVRNIDLYNEIIYCKQHNGGRASEKLGEMFIKIASKLANKVKYKNPDDRDDCISHAVEDCLRYFDRFDPDKSKNAFAYITTMCTNGFNKGWRSLGKKNFPDSIMMSLDDNIYTI